MIHVVGNAAVKAIGISGQFRGDGVRFRAAAIIDRGKPTFLGTISDPPTSEVTETAETLAVQLTVVPAAETATPDEPSNNEKQQRKSTPRTGASA